MDLSDALGGGWPAQPNQSTWPGQPAGTHTWPGGQAAGTPAWPGGQAAGTPTWPGGQPAGTPTWPGGQAAGTPTWPGGQPAGSGWPSQPSQPNPHPAQSGGWPSPASGPAPGPAPVVKPVPPPQQNLKVPYSQTLPQGVYDKLLITIAGTVKPNAQMFKMDMYAGGDLAFHFNPRFNENGKKVIVRNSRIHDKWGKEERDAPCFPFTQGQPFEMKILCTNAEFKVAVNQTHLLTFRHRIRDLSTIRSFNIYQDVTLSKVDVP